MNELQNRLMPYVVEKVNMIIDRKLADKIEPCIATYPEILSGIRDDVMECMMDLHLSGAFAGLSTLNHPALKRTSKE